MARSFGQPSLKAAGPNMITNKKNDLLQTEAGGFLLLENGSKLIPTSKPGLVANTSAPLGNMTVPLIASFFGIPGTLAPTGNVFTSDFKDQVYTGLTTEIAYPIGGNSLKWVLDPLDGSRYVAQFDVDTSDPLVNGHNRAEFAHVALNTKYPYTYRWGFYLPSSFVLDDTWDLLTQWHNTPDQNLGELFNQSPSIALLAKNGHFWLNTRFDPNPVTVNNHPGVGGQIYPNIDLGIYQTGIWYDWTLYVKWSYLTDGYYELHCNGQLVHSFSGPNAYNDQVGPYMKIGIYKFDWLDNPGQSFVSHRTAFFSHMIIDNGNTVTNGDMH